MTNRRQSLLILIVYFIIYALPSVLATVFTNLGSQLFLIQTLDYLVGAVVLLWLANRTSESNPIERQPQSWLTVIFWIVIGLVVAIVGQLIILQVTQWLGYSTASTNTTTLLTVGQKYPFFFLAIFVGAPIMEEIVFRKVLFGNFTPMLGTVGAAIVASLLFSFAHADGHLVLYALLGLWFCWLYRHTGRIQTSMFAHILMNAFVIVQVFIH